MLNFYKPAVDSLRKLKQLQPNNPDIDETLQKAEQKYKELVLGTKYRKTMAALQSEGLDYSSALDYMPGTKIVNENDIGSEPVTEQEEYPVFTMNQETDTVSIFKRAANKLRNMIYRPILKRKRDNDGADYM